MYILRRIKQHFKLAIASAWIGAFSLLSISLLSRMEDEHIRQFVAIVIGVVFWGSFIMEHTMFWLSNIMRKRKQRTPNRKNSSSIGLLTFFSTTKGTIVDVAFIISVILISIVIIRKVTTSWIVFWVVAMTYLTFNLHCMYNGVNYRSIIQPIKGKHEKEPKS